VGFLKVEKVVSAPFSSLGQAPEQGLAQSLDNATSPSNPTTIEASRAEMVTPPLDLAETGSMADHVKEEFPPPWAVAQRDSSGKLNLEDKYGRAEMWRFDASPELQRELQTLAPGVSFELGNNNVGVSNGSVIVGRGGLWGEFSVELATLKPGDRLSSHTQRSAVPGAPEGETTPTLRLSRADGTSFEVDRGSIRVEGDTFRYGLEPQRTDTTAGPPTYPILVVPGGPGATIDLRVDSEPMKTRYICAVQDSPHGATVKGLAPKSTIVLRDGGGFIADTASIYDDPADGASSVVLMNGRLEVDTGSVGNGRCTVETGTGKPLFISLNQAPGGDPSGSLFELDPTRLRLTEDAPFTTDQFNLDGGRFSIGVTTPENFDPSDTVIGLRYSPRVGIDTTTGDFAISPALTDTPLTITRTGDPKRPDISVHSHGNLHGIASKDSFLLIPPPTDQARARETLGSVTVAPFDGRAGVTGVITLDETGSLNAFGARTTEMGSDGKLIQSPWGAHWFTPAAKLHDAGLKPGLIDKMALATAREAELTNGMQNLYRELHRFSDEYLPSSLEVDSTNGSVVVTGLGPGDKSYISVQKDERNVDVYIENLSGDLMDTIAQTLWRNGPRLERASDILAHRNDLASGGGETEAQLTAAGLQPHEIDFLRTEAGEIFAHAGVREALSSVPFDFNLDTTAIEIKHADISFVTDDDGLRSFKGSLDLRGMQVKGVLPAGEIGNAVGAIVGAPGVLHDLGEGLDKATDNNPLVAPITIPAKLIGGIFKGGEVATKVVGGEVDITVRINLEGYEKTSGEWIITKDAVQIAEK
jgi:hypothetical protein